MTRQQPRFERDNLRDVGYVGARLVEIATDYPEYLGLPAKEWLAAVAAELSRRAMRMRAQAGLFEVDDVLADQIGLATDRKTLLRMREAHLPTGRWTARHDALARNQVNEIDRRKGG